MKKILLSVCVLVVATTMFAQQQVNYMPNDNFTKGYSTMSTIPDFTPSSSSATPPIWEDDCSNASNWVFTNTSTLNIDWRISMDPSEIPSADVSPIASATASNGYMFVSSDADGGPDNDGTTISCEFTNATPIDLTGYPAVQLTFEHCFRWWNDTRIVRISPDNGVTWVEVDEITNNTGYTYANQSSDNPHMSLYDISAVAGGQSEVLVQFYYNDNDIWAWFWGVDDIAISELPENNVSCSDEVMGGWWIAYQTVGGLGQDYSFNPISQATANPYAFESVVRNGGIQSQDITLHVEVEDASGTNVLSSTSNPLTLASSEQDTLAVNSTLTPAATGLYTAEMWSVGVNSTGVSTYSDTATKMTMVTDYVYGKDNGTNDGGYWRISRPVGGFEVSSTYDMYADADLYSVDVHISDWSVPGALVYATLYEEDIAGGDPIPLDVTDDYSIASADRGAWVSIPFSSAQSLMAGTSYRISVGSYIHFTDTVGVDVSDGGEYSVDGILDKDGQFSDPVGSPGWYTISDIPMLRMNFDPGTVSLISDIKQTIFNVYPNPSNGIFTIELDETETYDVTINNALGQTVMSATTSSRNTTIELSKFDKGVYTIELKDKNTIYTDKVIVE